MKDHFYVEELDLHFPERLDILIYAHDGRGLGHASRSIGIGMAVKRLYPELRVLFVSGTSVSQSLIGRSGLDWIKLPSYASIIENGVSTGIDGPANFNKFVLGHHRSQMLANIIKTFKPRCVLVDHSPLGKREELIQSLKASEKFGVKWILGLRAIIGNPKNFWSDQYRKVFEKYYEHIFWYGDSSVLGPVQIDKIRNHFGKSPREMGYVSRLYETRQLSDNSENKHTGTISLPWLSRKSWNFIKTLKLALEFRDNDEQWQIFINQTNFPDLKKQFSSLVNVTVNPVGEAYAATIINSDMAVIYGGYNSLMDVAAAGIPAIVVMREMQDQEQDEHIRLLTAHNPDNMMMIQESNTEVQAFSQAIDCLLSNPKERPGFNIHGSSNAAKELASFLK